MNKKSHVVISQCMWYLEDIAGIVFGQWHTRLANFSVDNFENKINTRIVSASAWYRLMIQQKLWKEDEKERKRERKAKQKTCRYINQKKGRAREKCVARSRSHTGIPGRTPPVRARRTAGSLLLLRLSSIYTQQGSSRYTIKKRTSRRRSTCDDDAPLSHFSPVCMCACDATRVEPDHGST